MSNVNKATLLGRVGKDPELFTTAGGKKVAKLSLATSRKYNGQEQTQWHRVTLWEKLADVVEQYVGKGDLLYIEGRIEYSQTEDKGVTRYWTDIVAHEMQMVGSKRDKASAGAGTTTTQQGGPFRDDEDLPW